MRPPRHAVSPQLLPPFAPGPPSAAANPRGGRSRAEAGQRHRAGSTPARPSTTRRHSSGCKPRSPAGRLSAARSALVAAASVVRSESPSLRFRCRAASPRPGGFSVECRSDSPTSCPCPPTTEPRTRTTCRRGRCAGGHAHPSRARAAAEATRPVRLPPGARLRAVRSPRHRVLVSDAEFRYSWWVGRREPGWLCVARPTRVGAVGPTGRGMPPGRAGSGSDRSSRRCPGESA